jgi:hypothetical protein
VESRSASEGEADGGRPVGISIAALLAGSAVALIGLYGLLRFVGDGADIVRGWSNPPQYAQVQRLENSVSNPPQPRERGDFDGDRVDDKLDVTYLHRDFVFAESTSGMLYVRSGASGAVLLAHPLPTPMNAARWCGDIDGDGRDEVWADTPAPGTVFAFVARAAD